MNTKQRTAHAVAAALLVLAFAPRVAHAQFLPGGPQTPLEQILPEHVSVRQAHQLLVSLSPDRSDPAPLEGASVSGLVYVFIDPTFGIIDITPGRASPGDGIVTPDDDIDFITFYLDDPAGVTPFKTEGLAPYDFAGTAGNDTALPFDTQALSDGPHTISARVVFDDGDERWVSSTFSTSDGQPPQPLDHELRASYSPERTFSFPLEGATVFGDIYVFLAPATDVTLVAFALDGTPTVVEGTPPFDFLGAMPDGTPLPLDTTALAEGPHEAGASLQLPGGTVKPVSADFTVGNTLPRLVFGPQFLDMAPPDGAMMASAQVQLSSSNGVHVGFELDEEIPWLSVSPIMSRTTQTIQLDADLTGLGEGTYTGTVTASSAGSHLPADLYVTLEVGPMEGCTPVPCGDILVELPYELDFESDHGFLADGDGDGTGFTYVQLPDHGTGLIPGLLDLDTGAGELVITTTNGIAAFATNTQDNAIGVGIDAPSQLSILRTTVVDPPAGTNNYEQAGLWFGTDDDNYAKCAFVSSPGGPQVQFSVEIGGVQIANYGGPFFDPSGQTIELVLRADPFKQQISAEAATDGGALLRIGEPVDVPDEMFSFDAAGIDPAIGTRSFGGLYATHRLGPASLDFRFGSFSVTEGPSLAATGDLDFAKTSFPMFKPTSLAWGPDDRLWGVDIDGNVHAFTLDADNNPVDEEVITALVDLEGVARLTLGMTFDPFSTPADVIVYLAHSNANQGLGVINSGRVTRLTSDGLGNWTAQHVITGLPRALANHSLNSLHFGSDLRLYIACGGITGAGSPPQGVVTEFGDRMEQPLSAALLVADIFAPGFDGTCNNAPDIFGPNPCDVVTYATGLRNIYDFVFHSNGSTYAADNGLGVTGCFPPSPSAPCPGFGDPALWNEGGDNPGPQNDPLVRIQQGKYYGHPNPSRGECVFNDGSLQGVAPLPNYVPPIFDLGEHKSANGIVEYPFDVGCVQIGGDLLISNYSSGDDLTRVKLTPDGLAVLAADSFVGGFNDPLPVAIGPDGTIFVGEFGGDVVTALVPRSLGCWTEVAQAGPLPQAVLDAGGAALDGKFYMVAGKLPSGALTTVRVYDPATDAWTAVANLPGPAVENPAVVGHDGKLYAFGGSVNPFSGAVTNAAAYNPANNTWTPLAPMSIGRGGPTARAIGNKIYVVGGMDPAGNSLASGEVYDVASNTWSPIDPMITRRDNPGSAVFDGKLYVFGGRTRNADDTTIDPTLSSVEMYDPALDTWVPRATMPTGRRTFAVGLLGGKAQIMGGEATDTNGAFEENEEYDPVTDTWRTLQKMATPRQGAAAATIGDTVYVAGGGIVAGSSFTALTEAFGF